MTNEQLQQAIRVAKEMKDLELHYERVSESVRGTTRLTVYTNRGATQGPEILKDEYFDYEKVMSAYLKNVFEGIEMMKNLLAAI